MRQRDLGTVDEGLVVGEPGAERHRRYHGQVAQAEEGIAKPAELNFRGPHPAILTVVVAPHIAIERARSSSATTTMVRRTERPTAIPTPDGPPLA